MRRLIIDTDTGSDDAWAVIEALLARDLVSVEAITAVTGNFPVDLCVKNSLIAEDAAGTCFPPVFRGAEGPLNNPVDFYSGYVHGEDGLSNMDLPMPPRSVPPETAVDALVRLVRENPGELEIVCIGPLTNIALAIQKDPCFARNVRQLWILGGSGSGRGNMTETTEYNVYVDPEAADIVLRSGIRAVWVTWDAAISDEITWDEAERLRTEGNAAGVFCERCTRSLRDFYFQRSGQKTFSIVDSVLMTAFLYPEIMRDLSDAECSVILEGEQRAVFTIDRSSASPNAQICTAVDTAAYKKKLFALLGVRS